MIANKQNRKVKSPWLAYAGYLFQSFLKRPFGYIVAILYVVYLAVILLIVPAVLHFEPLFIWNVGGFNMPIFNLYFIAAMAASIAVAVFRTGRDDGTELNLSAKPLTKGVMVGVKTAVYLIIMLIVSATSLIIVALIMPVFGQYNELTNDTGILASKYTSLILSVFIGNTVNMLFFGGIAVFISMVGGQVIIMIGTIGIVFLMCLMNFIYPQVTKSALEVLSERYDADILGYSCNTLGQYIDPEADATQFNFATIQCITDDDFHEDYHFDTYEYWTLASQESGRKSVNYIDIGKQLSSIYSSFGLDDSKLKEASKLVIGSNASYNYHIDQETHITDEENLQARNYPISYYGIISSQGKSYPSVIIVGGDMGISTNNWYAASVIFQVDFNSVTYASTDAKSILTTPDLAKTYGKIWNKMNDLRLSSEEKASSSRAFTAAQNKFREEYLLDEDEVDFGVIAREAIITEWEKGLIDKFDELSHYQKELIMSKNILYWSTLAQEQQNKRIHDYWVSKGEIIEYPYSSNQVWKWHEAEIDKPKTEEGWKPENQFNLRIFNEGIAIEPSDPEVPDENFTYSRLVTSHMSYAETFNNLYRYHVESFYNIATIISVWSIVSGVLFAGSIIVYKRTDFK